MLNRLNKASMVKFEINFIQKYKKQNKKWFTWFIHSPFSAGLSWLLSSLSDFSSSRTDRCYKKMIGTTVFVNFTDKTTYGFLLEMKNIIKENQKAQTTYTFVYSLSSVCCSSCMVLSSTWNCFFLNSNWVTQREDENIKYY